MDIAILFLLQIQSPLSSIRDNWRWFAMKLTWNNVTLFLLYVFIIYFLFRACRFSVRHVQFSNLSRFSRSYKYVDENSGALKLIKTRYFPRYVLFFSLVSSIGIQSRYITSYISLANSQFFLAVCRCFLHEHPSIISWRRRVYFRFFTVLR